MRKTKVLRTKTFTIVVQELNGGNDNIFVKCDGFTRFELIGVLSTFRDESIIAKLTQLDAAKSISKGKQKT